MLEVLWARGTGAGTHKTEKRHPRQKIAAGAVLQGNSGTAQQKRMRYSRGVQCLISRKVRMK